MSSAQRQYVALLNCRDCVVTGNHLTEGGRIKVGRPGRNIRIRSNVVENANDNAITVADINDGQSEDIVIDDNQVINPLAIGIYFGADGDSQTSSLMRLRNVRVRNNTISGNWVSACIFGRLPAQAEEFRVLGNTCTKTGPTVNAATGIRIRRPDGTHPPARDVKVENNRILTTLSPGASPRPLDFGGLFHTGNHDRVRVRNNEVVNVGERAMVFRDQITNAQILDNEIVGGVIQVEGTIQGAVQDHVIVGAGSVIAALAGAASTARFANALIGRRAHRVP
jgi:hypothetical protein